MALLYTPTGYAGLTHPEKKRICNGCGSKGLGGWLVPDTLYGLSVEMACNIHDYMYHVAKTIEEKDAADRVFLNNMIRIIEQDGGRLLAPLRRRRAYKYYLAVKHFGGSAFWADKNEPGTMQYLTAET